MVAKASRTGASTHDEYRAVTHYLVDTLERGIAEHDTGAADESELACVSGPQLEFYLGATTETSRAVPLEPAPPTIEVPNTSSDALYKWLRSPAGGAHGVKAARVMVAEARATLPTGENTVPRAARVDCDVSERCSFRALHRCPSCLFAICNNHAKQGSESRGEPLNRKCGKCGSLFPLAESGAS